MSRDYENGGPVASLPNATYCPSSSSTNAREAFGAFLVTPASDRRANRVIRLVASCSFMQRILGLCSHLYLILGAFA